MLDFQTAHWLVDGRILRQAGKNHPISILTGVFKTQKDGSNISVSDKVIWDIFFKIMSRNNLFVHPNYNTMQNDQIVA
jgi:hypothetical protein